MHGTAKNQAGSWRSCLLFNAFFAAKLVFSVCPGRQTTVDEVLRILILLLLARFETPGQFSSVAPPGALALSSP